MSAGSLDRRVQFMRAATIEDGFAEIEGEFAVLGNQVWAKRTDIRDDERWRAGEIGATITTRFVVHSSDFSRGVTPKDQLVCDGVTYKISGIKESVSRRYYLEITAAARSD